MTNTKPTLAEIQRVVCERKKITLRELHSDSRERRLAWPRQVAAYLCRELTDASYPMIGRELGGKDHSTALFADRKIRRLAAKNPELQNELQAYRERIAELVAKRGAGAMAPPSNRPDNSKFYRSRPKSVEVMDVEAWESLGA
jgi:hypothetical protein